MKRFTPPLALLLAASTCLADDAPAEPAAIHAVMYEFTFQIDTLAITHAQVIGGYPSLAACQEALPRVASMGEPQLDSGEDMQLECSTVRSKSADTPNETEPPKPKTAI